MLPLAYTLNSRLFLTCHFCLDLVYAKSDYYRVLGIFYMYKERIVLSSD